MTSSVRRNRLLRCQRTAREEERLARESVRRFVRERFAPLVTEHFRKGTFPMQLVPEMAELGIFGVNLTGYGCGEMSNIIYGLMMQELEYGDSGLRSFASVQNSLVMYPIWRFGSEQQKQHWLPRLARGQAIGCFGLTEPDFGSDPGGMRTRAHRDGTDWILNGSKMWITNEPRQMLLWCGLAPPTKHKAFAGSWWRKEQRATMLSTSRAS